jgi:phage protein D
MLLDQMQIPTGSRVADFEILIEGSPLSMAAKLQITSAMIDDDVSLPSMFTVEFTGLDDQGEAIPWLDDPLFSMGNGVEVRFGYSGALTTLFKGEITGLEPEFTFNRLPCLTVRGYDRRHRLQRGSKTRTFVQRKDSDIAAQIAQEAILTPQVDDSRVIHPYVLQANQTDLEFLQRRARQIQYEVVVEDKTLLFRPVDNADSAVLTLTLQNDLLEFYPCLSSLGQVSEVTVRGWDIQQKQAIVGRARRGDEISRMGGQESGAALSERAFGAANGVVTDHPVMTQAEADQLASARFNKNILELIEGEGICQGRTDLRAGRVIQIERVGTRFSGQYYVTATSHRYLQQGYYTHFTVRRNAL